MQDLSKMPCWFLGANSPKGYYSKFDQLFSFSPKEKCFLINGGPGTGKSTMLKKIASVLAEEGIETELIYCSADTDSLDAVMSYDGKIVAADATLPMRQNRNILEFMKRPFRFRIAGMKRFFVSTEKR